MSVSVSRRDAIRMAFGAAGVVGTYVLATAASDAFIKSRAVPPLSRPEGMPQASDVLGYVARHSGVSAPLAAVGSGGVRGVSDTLLPVHLQYLMVDADIVDDGASIDDFWSTPEWVEQAFICQYEGVGTMLDVGGDFLAIMLDVARFNGASWSVSHVDVGVDGDFGEMLEGCDYDGDTGILWVPRSLFFDENGDWTLTTCRAQAMVRVDMSEPIESKVAVRVSCDDDKVALAGTDSVYMSGYDIDLAVPLVTPDSVGELDECDVMVFLSGIDAPLNLGMSDGMYVDADGVLHISCNGATIPGIEVVIRKRESSLLDVLGARVALAAASFDSVTDMRAYPYGYLNWNDGIETLCPGGKAQNNGNHVFSYEGFACNVYSLYARAAPANNNVLQYTRRHWQDLQHYHYHPHMWLTECYNLRVSGIDELINHVSTRGTHYDGIYSDTYGLVWSPHETRTMSWDEYMEANSDTSQASIYRPEPLAYINRYPNDHLCANGHSIVLPGDRVVANTFSGLPAGMTGRWFRTIRNADWVAADHTASEAEIVADGDFVNEWNDCMLMPVYCAHLCAGDSPYNEELPGWQDLGIGHDYVGKIYGRVLAWDKTAAKPYIVFAFWTDRFGDGQSCSGIIRFNLRVSGYMAVRKDIDI